MSSSLWNNPAGLTRDHAEIDPFTDLNAYSVPEAAEAGRVGP